MADAPSSPRASYSEDPPDTSSRQPRYSQGPDKEVRKRRSVEAEEAEHNNHSRNRPHQRRRKHEGRQKESFL